MAKIELKGFVLTVNKAETAGERNTAKQVIIFKVPGYVDEYGDKKGNDEEWPLDVMGDNVAKLALTSTHEGKRAKATIYVNGQKYVRKSDMTDGWIINARLHVIEFVEAPVRKEEEKSPW